MNPLHRSGLPALVYALLLVLNSPEAAAQFFARETPHMRVIYYDRQHEYIVPHLMRSFESSFRFHHSFFGYSPDEKITVLLEDFDDYGYAGATAVPFNFLRLGIEPYKYVFDTSPSNERFTWVVNHELTHIVASDKAAGRDRFFRGLFLGKVSPVAEQPLSMIYSYLTNPRKYSPRWYHEGIAVFMETWMSGAIGRTMSGYDEMVFRAKVRDRSFLYDVVGLESEGTTIDFQIGANSYLYGARFVSYLALTFGPDKVIAWVNRTPGSHAYFASQFEETFGRGLDEEWERWLAFERRWQNANLDSIRSYPVTPLSPVSRAALGSVSQAYYDSARGKVFVAVNYPGQLAHIAALDIRTGELEKICDVYGAALYYVTSMAYDPDSGTIFYTTNNSRDWRHLYAVNVDERTPRRLLAYLRAGDLAFDRNDRSLWGVRHHNGFSSVVWIPHPYEHWYELVTFAYGKDLFDIALAPDGRELIGSCIDVTGKQTLIGFDVAELKKGKAAPEVFLEFENYTFPESFVFSRDGRTLYGTSYYSGVSNVFRLDRATKNLDVVTNAETGLFRPVPLSSDSLLVFEYTGEGFLPARIGIRVHDVRAIAYLGQEIVDRYPVVKGWMAGSPRDVNIDSLTTYAGEYTGSLGVQSLIPILEGYKDVVGLGARLSLSDPMQMQNVALSASWSPNGGLPPAERLHAAVTYHRFQWDVSAAVNQADFYDLFGPRKASRKGYSLAVQFREFLMYERPRSLELTLGAAGYGGLERLPDYQNIASSFERYLTLRGRLEYLDLRRSLGAVEYEEGWLGRIASVNNLIPRAFIPIVSVNLDYGVLLPIDHSSLWLRSAAGHSFGKRAEPFANFYFGGFRNNYVDCQDEHRYRESLSFPGLAIDAVEAREYAKGTVEWTLPPFRFRRLGVPSFYCTWGRVALFCQGLLADPGSREFEQVYGCAGGQVDFRFVVFARLDMTLSFGYAAAAARGERRSGEGMISLKIL
jgi:hypothetical protein